MDDIMQVNDAAYRVLRLLGKGKGGYSYLVTDGAHQFVLKQIHHEPCSYYRFGDKLASELRDYETLHALGIPMPQLLAVDHGRERLLKEYIEGETAAELLRGGYTDPAWTEQLRAMCRLLYPAGLNIDYYPTNFVPRDGRLYYIDYECSGYMEDWDLEHWGLRYWSREPVFRPYRDEDYEALCAFLIALNEMRTEHINWNWARLEWMIEHPYFDKSSRRAIGLWFSGERVVGAAIYDMYFGEAFCAALPEFPALYPAILDYAARELRDENGLAIALCDDCAAEIAAAEAAGFVRIEQDETIMERKLDGQLSAPLPEGFSVAQFDPETDLRAFQWLMWRGFDHGDDAAEFKADYEKTLRLGLKRRPHFDPRLSLAVLDPAGEPLAYCCLWHDARTDYAYVEPVCTVPAARGRGLAKAVILAALERARQLGAKRACVISDMAFYEKLGFEKTRHFTFYRKA